jgi:CheY-like chemotaxis protein
MKKINLVTIIEDDPIHLFLTKKHIERSCLVNNISAYKNGKAAYDCLLEIFEKDQELPQIIFLDINMPVWDGWQFLEEFLKIPQSNNIQIYILTSSNDEEDYVKARNFNLEDFYLVKPIDKNVLLKILSQ